MRVHLFLESGWKEKAHLITQFTERAEDADIEIVQRGPNLTTSEMYNVTQCDEKFKDGDLFVCNSGKTVGFLSEAWPVAIFGETGSLHIALGSIYDKYSGLFEAAKALAGDLERSTEATATREVDDGY